MRDVVRGEGDGEDGAGDAAADDGEVEGFGVWGGRGGHDGDGWIDRDVLTGFLFWAGTGGIDWNGMDWLI